jgi:hypothetical protein
MLSTGLLWGCQITLFPQFRWGKPGKFEIRNNILHDFDGFVKRVCQWVKIKILPRVGGYTYDGDDKDDFGKQSVALGELASNVVRQWGSDVFCGFGAYSVQEVAFRAGLYSPGYFTVDMELNVPRVITIPHCI